MDNDRIQQINEYLLQNTKTIYRLRKIQDTSTEKKEVCAYAVALAKSELLSLEEQARQFYDNCKKVLLSGEDLKTEDRCFKIAAAAFEVCYCLEAYRKTADRVAYIENEQVKIQWLHRMSCEQAAVVFKKHKADPLALINNMDTLQRYSNPADKYAALAKFPIMLTADM